MHKSCDKCENLGGDAQSITILYGVDLESVVSLLERGGVLDQEVRGRSEVGRGVGSVAGGDTSTSEKIESVGGTVGVDGGGASMSEEIEGGGSAGVSSAGSQAEGSALSDQTITSEGDGPVAAAGTVEDNDKPANENIEGGDDISIAPNWGEDPTTESGFYSDLTLRSKTGHTTTADENQSPFVNENKEDVDDLYDASPRRNRTQGLAKSNIDLQTQNITSESVERTTAVNGDNTSANENSEAGGDVPSTANQLGSVAFEDSPEFSTMEHTSGSTEANKIGEDNNNKERTPETPTLIGTGDDNVSTQATSPLIDIGNQNDSTQGQISPSDLDHDSDSEKAQPMTHWREAQLQEKIRELEEEAKDLRGHIAGRVPTMVKGSDLLTLKDSVSRAISTRIEEGMKKLDTYIQSFEEQPWPFEVLLTQNSLGADDMILLKDALTREKAHRMRERQKLIEDGRQKLVTDCTREIYKRFIGGDSSG